MLARAFVDRMSDVVLLGIVALYVIGVLATQLSGDGILGWLIVLAVAPIGLFVTFLTFGARLTPLVRRIALRLPGTWSERIPRWYAQLVEACGQLADSKRLSITIGLTVAAYCVDYAIFWLFLQAFQWSLPVHAAMTIGVLWAIGSMLPAASGYVGTYQLVCLLALKPYGVGESSALAYSVLAQGATMTVIALLGTLVATRYWFRAELTEESRSDDVRR